MDSIEINNRFASHPADTAEKRETHEGVRAACRELASYLIEVTPGSREQSLAITKLEEVMFWANAAVARPSLH